ncbi:hypothetical protein IWW51_006678, partial [Coemansia sp. RSA 2702]
MHEVSPSHTLYEGGAAHGKKKFAHFRRLFSSLHRRHHSRHAAEAQKADGSVQKRLQQPPTSSTVILRRPSTASSASTASDENAPVISDRATGFILETYGLPVRTIGQGTGGYVRLHQASDGRLYAVKTFTFPAHDRARTTTAPNVRQWKHL